MANVHPRAPQRRRTKPCTPFAYVSVGKRNIYRVNVSYMLFLKPMAGMLVPEEVIGERYNVLGRW